MPTSTDPIGDLKFFRSFIIGLVHIPPVLQYQIFGPHCLNLVFVKSRNYGLLGLDGDDKLLTSRTIGDGNVIHMGNMMSCGHGGSTLNITNLKVLTHFSAKKCGFYSGHLEQLAIACPNIQRLNLQENVSCLNNLQGLRAIAIGCRKLESLNIMKISV